MQINDSICVDSSQALDDAVDMSLNERELNCELKNPFGSGTYHGSQMIC